MLVSANHPIPWATADPGPALCVATDATHPPDESCPALACTCGFYAYTNRADAVRHEQGIVLARVALWGRLVQHARGYRAERIRLVALHVWRDVPADAHALETRYSIPVTVEEGVPAWTSVSPNALSSLNQFQNPWLTQTLNQSPPSLYASQHLAAQQHAARLYHDATLKFPGFREHEAEIAEARQAWAQVMGAQTAPTPAPPPATPALTFQKLRDDILRFLT